MPLLSLSCPCGNRWEALKTFSTADPTVDACPKCGKGDPIRVYESAAIQAKGYDYENAPAAEKQMALSNRRKIEAQAEHYLDGRATFVQPKGTPKEYQPQVPEHMRKKLY